MWYLGVPNPLDLDNKYSVVGFEGSTGNSTLIAAIFKPSTMPIVTDSTFIIKMGWRRRAGVEK